MTQSAQSTPSTPATRMAFLNEELERLKSENLYQSLREFSSPQGAEITMDGKTVLNFSSNNYLGLNTDPGIKKAAIEAIEKYGVGTGSVRTIIGTQDIHNQLEALIAEFKKTEASLVLQSGFMANTAAITSIMGEGDVILSDALNHASIIDACRMLKKVPTKVYGHSDMDSLEDQLKASKDFRRKLIVTDGVFSMDGDIAKLPDIVALAEIYDAMVMVDDAHASGVLGDHGSGTTSHFGLKGRVDLQIGTLSKAIGALGGYVASTQAAREIMINKARPFLFSTAHPPSVVASCMAAIRLLQSDDSLIEKLWFNTRYFKAGLKNIGLEAHSETPIVPVIVGDSEKAHKLSQRMFEEGVYVRSIVYPTVAKDKARVRVMISASHTQKHLDHAIEAFEKVGKELGIITAG